MTEDRYELDQAAQTRHLNERLDAYKQQRHEHVVNLALLEAMPKELRDPGWQDAIDSQQLGLRRAENAIDTLSGLITKR